MEPFKFIELKQKNRRIVIYVFQEESGELQFSVHTKRLLDFKNRVITRSDVGYSYHTFKLLSEMMSFILDDYELKKLTNRLDKYFEENRANAKTNVKKQN